jgi:5-methylthioadenosine/S-adenosylhomocysteine deaminase
METAVALVPEWVICVDAENRVLTHHAVIVSGDHISAIVPWPEAQQRYPGIEVYDLAGQALIPGLVNVHTHLSMNLLRGYADDLPLMTWLNDHIWPAEGKHVDPQFVEDGTRLAIAESLRGGVTCFNDMYFFPDTVARVADEIGIRASIGLITLEFPSAWAANADEYLRKGVDLHGALKDKPLISCMLAPHAPYTVSAETLTRIRQLSDQLGIGIHIHVHETAAEVEQYLEQHGMRPLQKMAELSLLTPQLAAVHMTQLTDSEISAYAAAGGSVLHCPESNLKLASGTARVTEMLDAGINVAIGTDGVASNNDLDMLGEMRSAGFTAKDKTANAAALPAEQILRMGTINGARALGLDAITGSIEAGKQADLTAVNFNRLELQPVYNPVSHLIYSANRYDVSNVWVAGVQMIKDGSHLRVDEAQLINTARAWGERIRSGTDT